MVLYISSQYLRNKVTDQSLLNIPQEAAIVPLGSSVGNGITGNIDAKQT